METITSIYKNETSRKKVLEQIMQICIIVATPCEHVLTFPKPNKLFVREILKCLTSPDPKELPRAGDGTLGQTNWLRRMVERRK